jgi:hypothetical protein
VHIPTDVSEFAGGRPHAAIDLTEGVLSMSNGDPMEFGSACCLVRDSAIPTNRYALSCYHVFSRTLARSLPQGIDCVANGKTIGPVKYAARAEGRSALDAALVRVDDQTISDISVWEILVNTKAHDFDVESLPSRGPLFVLGRRVAPAVGGLAELIRSRPVPATFRALIPAPMDFDYRETAGRYFTFADTIEYVAAVRPGDSGAALVDSTGMLYGMHFFGRNQFGYALAVPRLFDPKVFRIDIEL